VYREQEYVERCHCDAPAVGPCGSCGRARCAAHLERTLCNRCNQAIGRELEQRSNGRVVAAFGTGVAFTLAMLIAHWLVAIAAAIPLVVAVSASMRRWQRRRLITAMGPLLAASKGELPPPEREPDFPSAPPPVSPLVP
jgi:hypothetical protein